MDRDGERNDQDRKKRISPVETMPFRVGTTPTERQQRIHGVAPTSSSVSNSGKIGDRSHVDEDRAACDVGGNRHDIEQQRRAKIWPHFHLVGVREGPMNEPGSANMDHHHHGGDHE